MVNRHNRIPALLILVLAACAGAAYLRQANRAANQPRPALEVLEKKIADGTADKKDWHDYAVALAQQGKFPQATQAYRKVIELEPFNRQAKIDYVVTLANAGDKDGLGHYLKDLVYAEAKLALELFERKELKPFLADPAFENLQKEARAQAMD